MNASAVVPRVNSVKAIDAPSAVRTAWITSSARTGAVYIVLIGARCPPYGKMAAWRERLMAFLRRR